MFVWKERSYSRVGYSHLITCSYSKQHLTCKSKISLMAGWLFLFTWRLTAKRCVKDMYLCLVVNTFHSHFVYAALTTSTSKQIAWIMRQFSWIQKASILSSFKVIVDLSMQWQVPIIWVNSNIPVADALELCTTQDASNFISNKPLEHVHQSCQSCCWAVCRFSSVLLKLLLNSMQILMSLA